MLPLSVVDVRVLTGHDKRGASALRSGGTRVRVARHAQIRQPGEVAKAGRDGAAEPVAAEVAAQAGRLSAAEAWPHACVHRAGRTHSDVTTFKPLQPKDWKVQ